MLVAFDLPNYLCAFAAQNMGASLMSSILLLVIPYISQRLNCIVFKSR